MCSRQCTAAAERERTIVRHRTSVYLSIYPVVDGTRLSSVVDGTRLSSVVDGTYLPWPGTARQSLALHRTARQAALGKATIRGDNHATIRRQSGDKATNAVATNEATNKWRQRRQSGDKRGDKRRQGDKGDKATIRRQTQATKGDKGDKGDKRLARRQTGDKQPCGRPLD